MIGDRSAHPSLRHRASTHPRDESTRQHLALYMSASRTLEAGSNFVTTVLKRELYRGVAKLGRWTVWTLELSSESRTSRHGMFAWHPPYWTFGLRLSRFLVPELLDGEGDSSVKKLDATTHNVGSNASIEPPNRLSTNGYKSDTFPVLQCLPHGAQRKR